MIGILIFPDFQLLDAAGPIAAFEIAARFANNPPAIKTIAVKAGPVRSSSGVEMLARGLKPSAAITTLIIAGGNGVRTPASCPTTLSFVRRMASRGVRVASVCSGAYVLAEAGLLDGRRATITWWLQSELRRRHPRIDLASDAVITQADRLVCAAGPMSWVDLLLRLIELVEGAEVAKVCADYAVIDTAQRTQAIFMPLGYMLAQDPLLMKADMLVRRTGKAPITVRGLAQALGLSERTLNRRFRELTHEPPQAFITRRRVEHARTLLETTAQPIKAIARATGYEDESSFRKAFRKLTLLSPQAYRAQRSIRAA